MAQVPRNSMDLVPVGLACPTLPLTVVLLVTSEVSLLLADLDPQVLPSHSALVPMDPVVPVVLLTVDLQVLTGLTSSWDPATRGLITLDPQVLVSALLHTAQWDPMDPCMAHHLISWRGKV